MKNKEDKPRGRKSSKRKSPESTEGKRPGERQPPAAAERTDSEPVTDKESAAATPPDTSRTRPITNQDEQEKITNTDAGDDRIADPV